MMRFKNHDDFDLKKIEVMNLRYRSILTSRSQKDTKKELETLKSLPPLTELCLYDINLHNTVINKDPYRPVLNVECLTAVLHHSRETLREFVGPDSFSTLCLFGPNEVPTTDERKLSELLSSLRSLSSLSKFEWHSDEFHYIQVDEESEYVVENFEAESYNNDVYHIDFNDIYGAIIATGTSLRKTVITCNSSSPWNNVSKLVTEQYLKGSLETLRELTVKLRDPSNDHIQSLMEFFQDPKCQLKHLWIDLQSTNEESIEAATKIIEELLSSNNSNSSSSFSSSSRRHLRNFGIRLYTAEEDISTTSFASTLTYILVLCADYLKKNTTLRGFHCGTPFPHDLVGRSATSALKTVVDAFMDTLHCNLTLLKICLTGYVPEMKKLHKMVALNNFGRKKVLQRGNRMRTEQFVDEMTKHGHHQSLDWIYTLLRGNPGLCQTELPSLNLQDSSDEDDEDDEDDDDLEEEEDEGDDEEGEDEDEEEEGDHSTDDEADFEDENGEFTDSDNADEDDGSEEEDNDGGENDDHDDDDDDDHEEEHASKWMKLDPTVA